MDNEARLNVRVGLLNEKLLFPWAARHLVTSSMESLGGRLFGEYIFFLNHPLWGGWGLFEYLTGGRRKKYRTKFRLGFRG